MFSTAPRVPLFLCVGLTKTGPMSDSVRATLNSQSGVITRAQLRSGGVTKPALDRLVRRKELVRLLPGVFVNHTGELTWAQRAWAGTLYYAPAALARDSALRVVNGTGSRDHDDSAPIIIAIDAGRHLEQMAGYDLRRVVDLASKVHWQHSPPRMRIEEAVLDVVGDAASDFGALEVLAAACRSRRTTPQRLQASLRQRTRIKRRSWLTSVLADLADGTSSVLEHGYIRLVERAHALPSSRLQAPALSTLGKIYRDVEYEEFAVYVELDGSVFHDSPEQRDRDLDRDLDAATAGRVTLRIGWGQTFRRACLTAQRVGEVLQARGWTGVPQPCGVECALRALRSG